MKLLLVILVFILTGCLDGDKKTESVGDSKKNKVQRKMVETEFEREKSISARVMLERLSRKKENMVYSPMSLEYALGILALTAKGGELEKISSYLGVRADQVEQHLMEILEDFEKIDAEGRVKIANLVMLKKSLEPNEERLKQISENLGVNFQRVNFVENNEMVLSDLNGWINKNTFGKINNLISRLDPTSIFVIANALYFKMDWVESFKDTSFEMHPFFKTGSSKIDVEMMTDEKHYEYADFEEGQAVSLPFKTGRFSMWLIKPKKDLDTLIRRMKADSFSKILEKKYYQKVSLKVPRFRIENKLNMINDLKELGLESLTVSPNYNLGEFFKNKEDIIIASVIQGNFFDFNERGVEAASATVIGGVAGGPPPSDKPIELIFDKPFFFAVYHKDSGRFMFMGSVYEPK